MAVPDAVVAALRVVARAQHDVLSRGQGLAAGLTRGQWDGGAGGLLTPVLPGTAAFLSRGSLQPSELQRCQAALLVGRGERLLCLGSSLRLHGVLGTPLGDPEHVSLGGRTMHQRGGGLARHWLSVAEDERTLVHGLAATTVARALSDVASVYDDDHLLSVADSALHLGVADAAALAGLRVARLVDGRRESPLESRTALRLAVAGLRFEPQVTVRLPGYGLARLDFLLEGVVVECDGRGPHDELPTRYADRVRHEALERAGFVVVRVVWADIMGSWPATLKRTRDALYDAETRRRAGLRLLAERVAS